MESQDSLLSNTAVIPSVTLEKTSRLSQEETTVLLNLIPAIATVDVVTLFVNPLMLALTRHPDALTSPSVSLTSPSVSLTSPSVSPTSPSVSLTSPDVSPTRLPAPMKLPVAPTRHPLPSQPLFIPVSSNSLKAP